MSAKQLLVAPVPPTWRRAASWALHDGNVVYPGYLSEDDALMDALDAAQMAGELGIPVEIVIHRLSVEDMVFTPC
jgi:hypothetical protein